MGDYLRATRECPLENMRPALAAAIRAHLEKHGLTASVAAACETTSTKQKKGLFGGKAEVILTGALLAPPWLIWASGKEGEAPAVLSVRLRDIQIVDYEKSELNKLMPDTGLTLTGLRTDGVELGSAFIGLGPESAAQQFRAALKEAWAKARSA